MQVNSSHLPWLHSLGITERHLIAQPCTNISVGASILADMVRRFGMTWRAVGAYGAGSGADRDQIRGVYAARVRTALLGLQGRNRQAAAHAAAAPGPTVAESPSSTQPQLQVLE